MKIFEFVLSRGPRLLVQCIAVNIRVWLEMFFFFRLRQASYLSDTYIGPQNSAGLCKISEQTGSDCRISV